MEPGEARSVRRPTARVLAGLLLLLPTACASRPYIDRAVMAERGTAARNEGVAQAYLPGCPDMLEFAVPGRPDLTGQRAIGPDGRVECGPLGRVRVEGLTGDEIAARVAELAGLPPERVNVRIAAFRSQQVYVIGQVMGQQRAVPYQGPETVLDLLKRAGGVTSGAAPQSVYVVRSRVAEGGRPEVFHVDLQAVVSGNDAQTNVRLLPFDQVIVGESRRSSLEKCLPPWLRPAYAALAGMRRVPGRKPAPQGADLERTWAGRAAPGGTFRGTAE